MPDPTAGTSTFRGPTVLVLLGLVSVVVGTALIHTPSAFIVGGVLAVAVGAAEHRRGSVPMTTESET